MYKYSIILLASISMNNYIHSSDHIYGVMRYFKDKYKFERKIKDILG